VHRRPPHIHRPGHVCVFVSEQESNLIDALTCQQGAASQRVPKRMHGGQGTAWRRDAPSALIPLGKCREGRYPVRPNGRSIALRRARKTFRCPIGRPVRVETIGASGPPWALARLWLTSRRPSSRGIGTVRDEPSVFVGPRLPRRSTWNANSISASSRSSSRRLAQNLPPDSRLQNPTPLPLPGGTQSPNEEASTTLP
jgi:hypothetical protein